MTGIYRELDCSGPLIAYNGGALFDPGDPSFPCYSHLFPKEMVLSFYRKAKNKVDAFFAEGKEVAYLSEEDAYLESYFPPEGMKKCLGPFEETLKEDTYSLLFRAGEESNEFLNALASSYPDVGWRHWSGVPYSELHHLSATKGTALAYVKEVLGIPAEKVIAFGDSDNDRGMLLEAGTAFCMKDSKSALLRKSFPLTEWGSEADGVALTLEKILGI